MEKIAIVLFNLGGPDSENAIRPFLLNFFMDKNIINLPVPLRCILAWLISSKRARQEAGISYGELGGASPLLENTRQQGFALDRALEESLPGKTFRSFVCMRYWHPMAGQVVREVRDWGADKILLLPLYPQFSTTTTRSSRQQWEKEMRIAGLDTPTSMVCCYPRNDGFIKAAVANIKATYERAEADGFKDPRILFSAHGLPEKVIKGGDPYQYQCEETAAAIAEELKAQLGWPQLDWEICYQSKVGPMRWIGPSTESAIERAAKDKRPIVIFPHAFTQEHVETLVELDIEYKHVADQLGLQGYYRADTVGTHPLFIAGLADLVKNNFQSDKTQSETGARLCPENFSQCCMEHA